MMGKGKEGTIEGRKEVRKDREKEIERKKVRRRDVASRVRVDLFPRLHLCV